MEIERKFLIRRLPANLESYPRLHIEQGYLCTDPVLRIRRTDDACFFTYKSNGLMSREEIEVSLTRDAYERLTPKCDGTFITKTRYRIPEEHGYIIELDIFHGNLEGLQIAEIEFPSEESAHAFPTPEWFACDVTQDIVFHNSTMSGANPEITLAAARRKLDAILSADPPSAV